MSRQETTSRPRWYLTAIALLAAAAVALRARGLHLSLWQDEAWVANSVLEPSLYDMLFYEAWLQTSPPLFLLQVRAVVATLGMANWTFKLIPFVSGLLAWAGLSYLAERLFPRRRLLVIFLSALAACSPSGSYFSHVLKQYSGELLAGTALLLALWYWSERPSRPRFLLLLGTVVVGLCLAYGLALLVPAAMLVTCPPVRRWWHGEDAGWGQWLALGVSAGVVLALEYVLLVIPNSDPLLDGFWRVPIDGGVVLWATHAYSSVFILLSHLPLPSPVLSFTGARILAAAGALLIVPALALRTRRGGWRHGQPELLALVSLVTVVLAIGLGLLRVYPLVIRTSLIQLSCALVLAGYAITLVDEEYFGPAGARRWAPGRIAFAAALVILFVIGVKNRFETPILAEDVHGSMQHLVQEARDGDHIYVHASAVEGFKLYRRILDWTPPNAVLGDVGFPCCPRLNGPPVAPDRNRLRADLGRALPARRLWVLHSDPRGIQWESPGANYPALTAPILLGVGCREESSERFRGMAVRLFVCQGAHVATEKASTVRPRTPFQNLGLPGD